MINEKNELLNKLKGNLIVSCQALEEEALHSDFIMSKMAKAAVRGGAVGIRSNSTKDINAILKTVNVPVIGIIKHKYPNSDVHITPTNKEIKELLKTKCQIIALDATIRKRPKEDLKEQVDLVRKNSNKLLMADCATLEDVTYALELGFDIVSSTLVGYTKASKNIDVSADDFYHLKKMIELVHKYNKFFIAEGNIDSPSKAKRVLLLGADSVVVGSAITRPELITKKYIDKIKEIV